MESVSYSEERTLIEEVESLAKEASDNLLSRSSEF
jgi:hypothetical protein